MTHTSGIAVAILTALLAGFFVLSAAMGACRKTGRFHKAEQLEAASVFLIVVFIAVGGAMAAGGLFD